MAENVTTVERTTEYDLNLPERSLSRLSWGGIFIGLFTTLSLLLLFLSLGAAIGFTTLSSIQGGGSILPGTVGSGIWLLLSFVIATFFGAWVGTRTSRLYFKSDAMMEGFVIWAFSTVIFMVMATLMAGFAIRTTTAIASAALQAGAMAAQAGGEVLSQSQIQALQQHLMSALPGAAQAQAAGAEAAQTASTATAAAAWWYFITGVLSLIAGAVGGLAGIKSKAKKDAEVPVRYPMTLRPQHRTV